MAVESVVHESQYRVPAASVNDVTAMAFSPVVVMSFPVMAPVSITVALRAVFQIPTRNPHVPPVQLVPAPVVTLYPNLVNVIDRRGTIPTHHIVLAELVTVPVE